MLIDTPKWFTPHEKIIDQSEYKLLQFSDGNTPALIVPPQAGHHSCIADYNHNQSLIEVYRSHGYETYAIEWKSATYSHIFNSISTLCQSVKKCIGTIGKPVHLVGLCQGGWLSTIFASEFTDTIRSLTIAGSPIDFYAGDSQITKFARSMPLSMFQWLVFSNGGIVPGRWLLNAWESADPIRHYVTDPLQVWKNRNNPKWMTAWRRWNSWWKTTQNIAGSWYLQCVEHLFQKNKLIQGKFELNGNLVDIKRIKVPIRMITGERDKISPKEQVFVFDGEKHLLPSGHIGCFMGHNSIKFWNQIIPSC